MPKRVSAFDKALKEAQGTTVQPQDSDTATPSHSALSTNTVQPQESYTASSSEHSETVQPQESYTVAPSQSDASSKLEKVTFYLTHEQVEKLDMLEFSWRREHRKRTRRRPINRNDIIRHLIDQCTEEDIQHL